MNKQSCCGPSCFQSSTREYRATVCDGPHSLGGQKVTVPLCDACYTRVVRDFSIPITLILTQVSPAAEAEVLDRFLASVDLPQT